MQLVTALAVGLVLATVLLVAVSVDGTGVGAAPHPPLAAAAPAACRAPAPTTAAGYQRMFDGLYGDWAGGDQALSVTLPDARTLWIFADTISGTRAPDGGYAAGWSMRHSAFVVQDGGCLTPVGRTNVLPDAGPDDWYWPNSALVHDGRLYLFAMRVHRTGPNGMDFTVTGPSVAVFALPHHGAPALERLVDVPTPAGTPILWGAGVLADGAFAYVYGTRAVDTRVAWGRELYVARVPLERLMDVRAWRYFDGARFSADARAAVPVIGAAGGVSTSVSAVHAGPRVAVISKRDEAFGTDVVAWTARTPYGPFTAQPILAAPSLSRPGELRYSAVAHPDLPVTGGLLITVCRNNLELSAVAADSRLYRPQFAVVPAAALGAPTH